ncbi:MAG: hypothetical protein R3E76_01480 [Planctomycetota bacterium]
MKPLLAALAGFALIGAVGATQVNAQGVRININKGSKSVQIDTRSRSTRTADFRKPERVENHSGGHFAVIKKKVWIAGHYEHRDVRVFIPAKTITVRERRVDRHGCVFYVNVCKTIPARHEIVCKEVFVPGRYEIREERVWIADDCGCDEGHEHGKSGGHGEAGGHGSAGHGSAKKKAGKHNRGKSRRGGR